MEQAPIDSPIDSPAVLSAVPIRRASPPSFDHVRAIAIGAACILAVIGNAFGDARAAAKRSAAAAQARAQARPEEVESPSRPPPSPSPADLAAAKNFGLTTLGGSAGGLWGATPSGSADAKDIQAATGAPRAARGMRPARLRAPTTLVMTGNGKLPVEIVHRIVRQSFGRFRLCFEEGARSNPALAGRTVTKLVIDRTGAVVSASDVGSDLPSQVVVGCVTRAFGALSFPAPEGGVVGVTYPISFSME